MWRHRDLHKQNVLCIIAGESLDSPPPPQKHVKGKTKPNKVRQECFMLCYLLEALIAHNTVSHSVSLLSKQKDHNMKGRVEQPKTTVKPAAAAAATNGLHAAGVRPKRAAALSTKTYKEPDSDDSQPESEKLLPPKAKGSPIFHLCQVP